MSDAVDDDLAGSTVFRKPPARAWAVSLAAHAGVFALLGVVGTYIGVRTGVIPPSIIEFDAPPPRRPPPVTPPPQRPAPAQPDAPRQPTHAPRPSAHSNRPARAGHVAAPHVLAAPGNGNGGDEMPVGDNNDFQGGTVGNGGGDVAPPAPPAPAETAPAPAHRDDGAEVTEENLAVRAVIDCDDAALAGLYPQQALDNEVEVPVLAVEMTVTPDGALSRAHARANPGFGIAAAMEQGALAHCRVVTVPRDVRGNAVRTRVVKRIRFQFD